MANVTEKIIRFQLLTDQPVEYEVSLSEETLIKKPRIQAKQVHEDLVQQVDINSTCLTCDGLITKENGLLLTVRHADCQAALFFDPVKKTLAVIHSGWRGSVKNIYQKCIDKFYSLGSNPKDILVCIGPSLGPESAEFINYKEELPKSFHDFQRRSNFFDFWAISRMQLLKAGILDHHLEIAKIDTYQNLSYPSYRRDKTTKRMTTNAALAL